MPIGIICEGHTDRAVIINILKGLKGIDSNDVIALRPLDDYDNTDLSQLEADSFGGWNAVHQECVSKEKIKDFLSLEGNEVIIIQIDSDIAADIGVQIPDKASNDYVRLLRSRIIEKLHEWLNQEYIDHIVHAISIEAIEAWVLTIYLNRNTVSSASPKERLIFELGRRQVDYEPNFDGYLRISKDFKKSKHHKDKTFANRNESLSLFCEEVLNKIPDDN